MNGSFVHPAAQPAQPRVRVLVVDDSAFMRYTITSHLSSHPQIEVVGSARNGEDALTLIPKLNPDVITLDVEMPHMDGLTTLKHIMANFPRPVIMLSSLTTEGAVETIQALTLGAVDFVAKPAQKTNIQAVMDEVISKILHGARARVWKPPEALLQASRQTTAPVKAKAFHRRTRQNPIVLIGSSTGGPRALNQLIPALPANLPAAVLVVQHMPAGFTRSLADRLNSISQLAVKEAEPGDVLEVGRVLLAPGGFHLTVNAQEQVALNQNPPVHGVRPAIDVALLSLVQHFKQSVISVILTGMGSDGTNGSLLLHSLGGCVIAEDESTCVVYGMPRSVIDAKAASQVAPLPKIARAIEDAVNAFSHNKH